LQSAGPVEGEAAGDDDGAWDVLDTAGELEGLAEVVPGCVVPCVCGWLGPQAVSIRAAAAAAVVITNPLEIRRDVMA
jgi:hypothetical protein